MKKTAKWANAPLVFVMFLTLVATLFISVPSQAKAADMSWLNEEEQAVVNLVNMYRRENGLGELMLDDSLLGSARFMAADMGNVNYFGHTDSVGRNPFQRIADWGFWGGWKGENLAAGASSAWTVVAMWRTSPGHNANLLNPSFNRVGVGLAYYPNSAYGHYWTMTFGG